MRRGEGGEGELCSKILDNLIIQAKFVEIWQILSEKVCMQILAKLMFLPPFPNPNGPTCTLMHDRYHVFTFSLAIFISLLLTSFIIHVNNPVYHGIIDWYIEIIGTEVE